MLQFNKDRATKPSVTKSGVDKAYKRKD